MLKKHAVRTVLEELKRCKVQIDAVFDKEIAVIGRAKSVNGVMLAKQRLLVGIIEDIPLNADACYFCALHEGCAGCEYAEKRGHCGADDASFTAIETAWEELQNLIEETYW